MTTSKLMLNKARRLNDGTYPLVMQLIHLRKKRVIYLEMYLHPEEFDEDAERVVLPIPKGIYHSIQYAIICATLRPS